jgi:hypothetical protein
MIRIRPRFVSVAPACIAVVLSAGGCAVFSPDREVRSTVTLAPGQVVRGRFEISGGSVGLVKFHAMPSSVGVPPHEEATTWNGDGRVLIAFSDTALAEERPLGYAQQWLPDGCAIRVVVRNTTTQPSTFTWTVTGSSDAVVDWDVSAGTSVPQK